MNQKLTFTGIIPPLVTPLLPDFTLDSFSLEKILNHVIDAGVHGVFILGTTGESPSLQQKIKIQMIRETCKLVNHRIPVLVGITDCSMGNSLELAEMAKNYGADALVAAPPFYMNISQEDLEKYYRDLANRTELPLLLYNIPSHSKTNLNIETVIRLSTHPNILGIKDSTDSKEYLTQLSEAFRTDPDFILLMGPEERLLDALQYGFSGGVSGGANAFPEVYVKCYESFIQGKVEEAQEYQNLIWEISQELYHHVSHPSSYLKGLKECMKLSHLSGGILSPPQRSFTEEERQTFHKKFERIKSKIHKFLEE
ncbi:dihydrodipicolinate synthase family protein [Algoriphagus marincola]|uniref:Dihydrodipicolinate synthase family protein n=1 Tax=Algoriphagus marincola TaxID=264027 RepID=A0ABS7N368_9BACT|nr:dihydrodipicolinate synthase family protein [Algoriphagus marincola]MBY5950762.1 dihydrodipicolinate synthase family protein [Algoriphagus marincola]